jgi:hypothetical protein
MSRRPKRCGGLRRPVRYVALDGRPVCLLDGPQPGGDPRLAGCDRLAVTPPVGALGQALTEPLDLTDMGLALVGVSGDGVDGNIRGGGVEDEAYCFPRDLSPL